MATGVSDNIAIGDLAQTPPPTDYDGDESFVVLGRSPTSFTFNENASLMLQDALKSLSEDQALLSVDAGAAKNDKEEPTVETDKSKDLTQTEDKKMESVTGNLANLSLEEIQSKVDEMLLENQELKETIQQNNMAMKKQCETILQWQEDVQRVHDSHKAKFEETKQYIEKLQMENISLKEELQKSQEREMLLVEQQRKNSLVDKSSIENVQQFELKTAQKRIEDLEVILKEKSEELELSQQKIEALQATNQKLIAQFELTKADWSKEKRVFNENLIALENALAEERNSVIQLKGALARENQRVLELSSSFSQNSRASAPPDEEQLEQVRQQLMNAQMHITDLELSKSKFQQTLNDKELEIQRLEKQISDSSDVQVALRAQLELYKADYEAEAVTKNSLLAEKNQIAEDLQSLQRRNQQLIEEVERLRRDGDFVHVSRPRSSATSSSSSADTTYACPKCSFRFADYTALENHVYRCIELDALP